jgi:hypothetical protein
MLRQVDFFGIRWNVDALAFDIEVFDYSICDLVEG